MKFLPNRLLDYFDEALVMEIRRVADIDPARTVLPATEFASHARVGLTTIRRRFGDWRSALAAAGLSRMYKEVAPARISRIEGRGWTEREVIEELRRVAVAANGEPLTVQVFRKYASVGPDTVRARFSSWDRALQAAGIETSARARRYTDGDCFENMLAVWMHYGRPPHYREMGLPPSRIGGKAYVLRWKSWNAAIHAFSEQVEKGVDVAPRSEVAGQTPERPIISGERQPRDPSLALRYQVLKRDRFRCVTCGRSPATDVGCVLHLDHFIPFSKGGRTELANLRVLCEGCNLGKGDHIDEDV